ncbi:uncharacterized protein DFL_008367 [Arthrobotrys flagrans]|uniref:Uncharacterized protein n=1 Tax=Arthrobotrys flagrans TaxID=97331 RepID=A0A436ZNL4_ARTFL|nr:hypothetical protein DFL_008367 [Arthrobotrys flagrans]
MTSLFWKPTIAQPTILDITFHQQESENLLCLTIGRGISGSIKTILLKRCLFPIGFHIKISSNTSPQLQLSTMPCRAHAWPLEETEICLEYIDRTHEVTLGTEVAFSKCATESRWCRRISEHRETEARRNIFKSWNYKLATGIPIIKKIRGNTGVNRAVAAK